MLYAEHNDYQNNKFDDAWWAWSGALKWHFNDFKKLSKLKALYKLFRYDPRILGVRSLRLGLSHKYDLNCVHCVSIWDMDPINYGVYHLIQRDAAKIELTIRLYYARVYFLILLKNISQIGFYKTFLRLNIKKVLILIVFVVGFNKNR